MMSMFRTVFLGVLLLSLTGCSSCAPDSRKFDDKSAEELASFKLAAGHDLSLGEYKSLNRRVERSRIEAASPAAHADWLAVAAVDQQGTVVGQELSKALASGLLSKEPWWQEVIVALELSDTSPKWLAEEGRLLFRALEPSP